MLNFLVQLPKKVQTEFETKVGNVATGSSEPPELTDTIALIINGFLGIMGVIFLVLAVYGGFTWMKARGNEKEVEKAKGILTDAIIGIIVVFGAYAISRFILEVLVNK